MTWSRNGPAPRRSIIQPFGASAAAVTADTEHLPMLLQDVGRQAGATFTDVSCISVTLKEGGRWRESERGVQQRSAGTPSGRF